MPPSSGTDMDKHIEELLAMGTVPEADFRMIEDLMKDVQRMKERREKEDKEAPDNKLMDQLFTTLEVIGPATGDAFSSAMIKKRLQSTGEVLKTLADVNCKQPDEVRSWVQQYLNQDCCFYKMLSSVLSRYFCKTKPERFIEDAAQKCQVDPHAAIEALIEEVKQTRKTFLTWRISFRGVVCVAAVGCSLALIWNTCNSLLKSVNEEVELVRSSLNHVEEEINKLVDETTQILAAYAQPEAQMTSNIFTLCMKYKDVRHELEMCINRLTLQKERVQKRKTQHQMGAVGGFLSALSSTVDAAINLPLVSGATRAASFLIPAAYGASATANAYAASQCAQVLADVKKEIERGNHLQERLDTLTKVFYDGQQKLKVVHHKR